jgi:hypothetical protein
MNTQKPWKGSLTLTSGMCSTTLACPQVYFGGEAGTTEGYNHMIRFWMTYFFDQPDIQKLDYYMRLDTDSFILSKIKFDIFQEVQVGL